MLGNRQTAPLIAVGVVGAVIVLVLSYVLYSLLTGSDASPVPTPAPPATAVDQASSGTPTPAPPTATPTATSTPVDLCTDGLRLLQHLSYDPHNMTDPPVVRRGRRFTKGWRVQNTGTCVWDPGYSIVYVDGNHAAAHMDGAEIVLHGRTEPLETYDVEVKLIAPNEPGIYQGYWQLRNAAGDYLGERLPVAILVPPLPTPGPTSTPRPVTTIQLDVDRQAIVRGECAVFTWTVTNAQAAYFYSEGQAWQDHGVALAGSRQVCPERTMTYILRVVRASGWVDARRAIVHVEQPPDPPQIVAFTAQPERIAEGECVTLDWQVEGQATRVRVLRGESVLWDGAPLDSRMSACPLGSGQVEYALEATGPGGITRAQRTVRIGATPTPTPAPLAGTEWQVLAIGGSMPAPAALPLTVLFGRQDATGQGTVAGWGGCNTYSATYRQSGALLNIEMPAAGSNPCEADVAAQEQALLDALHETATLTRSGGQLTLWNNAGEVVLNLAVSEAAAP